MAEVFSVTVLIELLEEPNGVKSGTLNGLASGLFPVIELSMLLEELGVGNPKEFVLGVVPPKALMRLLAKPGDGYSNGFGVAFLLGNSSFFEPLAWSPYGSGFDRFVGVI